ncbi:MAG: FkbM family methyltransferase [Candidatus Daviesbacteria bacterium]|nr:FkbM family methyltransferase [Candidatus Daviesbacteria bacterium]
MNYLLSFQKVLNHPNNKGAAMITLGRLLLWKLNQLTLRRPVIVNLTQEMKCICHPDSSFGSLIIYTKFPEYEEMKFFYDFIKKDDVFVDVGANIGAYSLLASSKIKKGKIFAFEPSKKAALYLRENIKLNHLENLVTVIESVVSDKDGFEKFTVGRHSEVDRIKSPETSTQSVRTIASTTLDKFLKSKRITYIDMVKIDVEGAELKILKGLKSYLKNSSVGSILFEVNLNCKDYGSTIDELFNFLEDKGFIIYSILENNKIVKLKRDQFDHNNTVNALAVSKSRKAQGRIKRFL